MTTSLPMELPKCSGHGIQMIARPPKTPEQRFCGAWYECPRCSETVLFVSSELRAQLEERRRGDA